MSDDSGERFLRTRIVSGPEEVVSELPVEFAFELVQGMGDVGFECRVDEGAWEACQSPARLEDIEAGRHEFWVRAESPGEGTESTSDWRIFRYVPPPETTIDTAPDSVTTEREAYFAYSSAEANEFECRLDEEPWAECPVEGLVATVDPGEHVFQVRASTFGVVDPTPARHEWTVTRELDTGIDAAPDDPTNQSTATFDFSGVHADGFECRLDGAGWEACTSPQTYQDLEDGQHTFSVRSTSAAGRKDPMPVTHEWTIDTQAPQVTITSAPADPSSSLSSTFEFQADEMASFECRRNGGSWAACNSPKQVSVSQQGNQTFAVRATDAAGNTSMPASHTWEVRIVWRDMAVGDEHGCGVQDGGSLWCWGNNDDGQVGVQKPSFFGDDRRAAHQHVSPGTTWSSVEAGGDHSCGIRTNGTLWCWGKNNAGQLGDGTTTMQDSPVQVGSSADWRSVSLDEEYTCGVRTDDTLWCWGDNGSGNLGDGTETERHTPVQIGSPTKWDEVDTSDQSTCGLAGDGTLWCWGDNAEGQLGDGTTTDRLTPVQVGSSTDWTGVSIGEKAVRSYGYACGTRSDGTLWCWGDNSDDQLGHSPSDSTLPSQVGTGQMWSQVDVAVGSTCAVKTDGTLWCWGTNPSGAMGVPSGDPVSSPTRVGGRSDWEEVGMNGHQDYTVLHRHSCGLTAQGTLHCWGLNRHGALGSGHFSGRSSPVRVGPSGSWSQVSAGYEQTCGVQTDGTLWCWGRGDIFQLGLGTRWNHDWPNRVGMASNWKKVAVGGPHSCGVRTDGTLWCWGKGGSGQIGTDGQGLSKYGRNAVVPRQVGSATDWVDVDATPKTTSGDPSTCGLKRDGSLWCWGANSAGLLGIGSSPAEQKTPAKVDAGPWTSVSLSVGHKCGVKMDGTLWCWGRNGDGELGLGHKSDAPTPTQVGTGTDWSAVAAGDRATCAIRTDGTLWCWGGDHGANLGNGSSGSSTTPQKIGSATNWKSVAAGDGRDFGSGAGHMCAGRNDGTIWCWGKDIGGRLGNGSAGNQDAPGQVGMATHWAYPVAGRGHTCGLDTSGSLWCWGQNSHGQLGIASFLKAQPSEPLP